MGPVLVNARAIAPQAIAAEAQNHPAASAAEAERDAARALVVRELLLQEADRLGIEPEPEEATEGRRESEEEARVRLLLAAEVHVPLADEDACRRYHRNNQGKFRSPDLFEPAHILLSADREDEPAYSRALAEAQVILDRLKGSPDLFETIARERSDCRSARDGGRLGQVSAGQTAPEFESFLRALEDGQLCSVPIRAPYGVHVLRLDRKIEGRPLPFEAVHAAIAKYLEEASWRRAVAQYVGILAGRADIVGVEIAGTASPLVQ